MRSLDTFATSRKVWSTSSLDRDARDQTFPSVNTVTLGADIARFCDNGDEYGADRCFGFSEPASPEESATPSSPLNLHYQPIVRASDHEIIGAEALLRWRHPQIGLCSAPEVLRAATLRGRSRDLDELIVDRALDEIAHVLAPVSDPDPYLGVNINPQLLAHPGFLPRIRTRLEKRSLDPSGLVIEVPDHTRVLVDPVAERTVAGLQNLGILICLDEAGPGGGVLATVRHLDIDTIKINRKLIARLHHSAVADSIGNLVEKSRRLGTRVIAVGVTNRTEVNQLRLLGCDFLQGHHFGTPVESHAFVRSVSA